MNTIPSINQIYESILSQLESEYGIELSPFGKVFLKALALVQAGKLKLLYLHLGEVQKNIFPDTADPESVGGTLERFGRVKLNRDRFPATAGKYSVTVTGTAGAVVPPQTTFKSNDDSSNPGMLFICDSGYTLTGSGDSFHVRALVAGTGSQLNVGDQLTATIPLANVDQVVTVDVEITTPLAAETIEDYRDKILLAFRLEPQGGAGSDYTLWALDAQGVKMVYPYAKSGAPGEIDVFVEATIADSTDGKGTPSQAILDAVADVIEVDPNNSNIYERGRRPLGVLNVNVIPVTVLEVDITITSFSGLTAEIESAIEDGLEDDINTIRPFVASRDVLEDKNDILDTNRIIAQILSIRPGSSFGAITLSVGGVEYTSFTFVDGDIPHLNSVTFS